MNLKFNTDKINRILHEMLTKQNKSEFNIFIILCFAPKGLTLFDLIRLTNIKNDEISFGAWESFLQKFFTTQKDESKSQASIKA